MILFYDINERYHSNIYHLYFPDEISKIYHWYISDISGCHILIWTIFSTIDISVIYRFFVLIYYDHDISYYLIKHDISWINYIFVMIYQNKVIFDYTDILQIYHWYINDMIFPINDISCENEFPCWYICDISEMTLIYPFLFDISLIFPDILLIYHHF